MRSLSLSGDGILSSLNLQVSAHPQEPARCPTPHHQALASTTAPFSCSDDGVSGHESVPAGAGPRGGLGHGLEGPIHSGEDSESSGMRPGNTRDPPSSLEEELLGCQAAPPTANLVRCSPVLSRPPAPRPTLLNKPMSTEPEPTPTVLAQKPLASRLCAAQPAKLPEPSHYAMVGRTPRQCPSGLWEHHHLCLALGLPSTHSPVQ